jgi:hypothetical protein
MDKKSIDSECNTQGLVERITNFPDKFKHLQVFLHRERDTDIRPDDYFLMVTPQVFGIVKVLDLKVEGNFINIEFLDCTMQEVGSIKIDIHDARPTIFFICWQDVKKMVLGETISSYCNNDLLEFDYN